MRYKRGYNVGDEVARQLRLSIMRQRNSVLSRIALGIMLLFILSAISLAQENQAPVASFTYSPLSPRVGEKVIFDASASSDPDGSIAAYEWDFDSDGVIDGSGVKASYGFPRPGEYIVKLIVIDDQGLSAFATEPVTVVGSARNPWDYFLLEGLTGSVGAFGGGLGGALIGFALCPRWWEEPGCLVSLTASTFIGALFGAVTAVDITATLVGVRGSVGRAYLTALGGLLISVLLPYDGSALGIAFHLGLIGFGAAFGYNIGAEMKPH